MNETIARLQDAVRAARKCDACSAVLEVGDSGIHIHLARNSDSAQTTRIVSWQEIESCTINPLIEAIRIASSELLN